MQIRQLFQLHCAFRSLRLLAGDLSQSRHFYHIVGGGDAEPVCPGDLLLAIELQLPEETPRLLALVEQTAAANGSGIVVRSPSGYHSPELEAASSANGGLPILSLPQWGDASFSLTQLYAALKGPQVYSDYIYQLFRHELARLLQHPTHYSALFSFLSSFLNREATLFSNRFLLPTGQQSEALRNAGRLLEDADPALLEAPLCRLEGDGCLCCCFSVRNASHALATLCVLYTAGEEMPDTDRRLIQALLPYMASLLTKSIQQMECLYKRPDEFLEAIFMGNFSNHPEQLDRNARYLGMDSQREHILWIIDRNPHSPISPSRLDEYFSSFRRRFSRILRSGRLIYVMEWENHRPEELRSFCQKLISSLPSNQRFRVSLSPCFHGLAGIPDAFSQADFTSKIGRKLSPDQSVHTYGEYMLYDFLNSVRHTPAISQIYEEIISTLSDYDRDNNAELLSTLRCLCASNFNAIQTADQMYLHRNSLYKRIERMGEILDMDLEQPDSRIILQLAVKLYDLLH